MGRTLAKAFAAELEGIQARLIEVEVDLNVGLHSFNIVGLADKGVSEAKERVSSALKNSGFKPPTKENRKITVNLAPADIKKSGTQYDLGIAIGYLLATEQIKPFPTQNRVFVGELALDGTVRSVPGALNTALLAKDSGLNEVYVPKENAPEASLIDGITIFPVRNLGELVNHLSGNGAIVPHPTTRFEPHPTGSVDISEIRGQEFAKRALTVAAAGGHNILMSGPPGSGKTMLAQALISLLPPMTLDEAIEVSQVWSSVGLLKGGYAQTRPFRAPHQTASPVAIIGGGTNPRPGEISLAHRGVLFLDELPEFRRDLLEAMRQPLESGEIVISRVRRNLLFPAQFIMVTAMNPCPCGFWGDEEKECTCSAYEVHRYQKKISGPLLDRIDIQINVPRTKYEHLKKAPADASEFKNAVVRARGRQRERLEEFGKITNSELTSKECERLIKLSDEAHGFVKDIFDKSALSTRGYYRLLKTAQTVADLANENVVGKDHVAEAFQLRIRE